MKIDDRQLKRAADTIRCLCADMVERANSGHPGVALGLADAAATLWLRHLDVDPRDPSWACRDRLVFSGGHASSLVYALFHLAGVGGVTLDELKSFRQFGSRCAGHPERGLMPGVEVTTGPLGQGVAMGVGLALAAKKADTGSRTWVFCGDGDLEEGISHEACSWAGAMKLDNLVLVYDSNGITIEGGVSLAMADDTKKRFESYGWKVLECDGHDFAALDRSYRRAMREKGRPAIVVVNTHIGFGAPTKHDSAAVHGAPLGAEELAGMKKALGFDPAESFAVPADVYETFAKRTASQHRAARRRTKLCAGRSFAPAWPGDDAISAALPAFEPGSSTSTRDACGKVMNAIAPLCPGLVGGSADLAPSNKTYLKGLGDVAPGSFGGQNVHYGVRELAMAAIANGVTAFGGFRGYAATFFVFSDYCRPALRLAALMKTPTVFVFSHDSFYVGEDGPTHEPVEHLAALRTMPGVTSFRPADANETAFAWAEALANESGPTCIMTTRQGLPVLAEASREGVARGGYVIFESRPEGAGDADVLLFIATGSEVPLCMEAAKRLAEEGRAVRVVSMPSVERFLAQDEAYREAVAPRAMSRRVVAEAGVRFGWDRFAVDADATRYVTMDRYGASGPYKVLAREFGFTVEAVLDAARGLLGA